MSWFFKTKSDLPAVTQLQQKRAQQIESLKRFNHNVSEIKRDEEYRVSFTVSGHTIALNITLPPQFPEDKPIVKVSPPLRHQWVNKNMMVTSSPGLNNFVVNSDLGTVIRNIVLEFEKYPPVVVADSNQHRIPSLPYSTPHQPYPQMTQYGPPSTSASSTAMFSMYPNQTTAGLTENDITAGAQGYQLQCDFPELQTLSVAELKDLMEDEDKVLNMVVSCAQMKKLEAVLMEMTNMCEESAKNNMSYKPELEREKQKLRESYDKMTKIRNSFDMKCLRQQSMNEQNSPETILYNLRVSAVDAESDSEQVAQNFLDNNLEIDEFMKSFMESRKKAHLRKVKEEKLHTMIIQQGGGGGGF